MSIDQQDKLTLEDGSRIGVVGGGPSGSFFAYFALDFADRMGLDITIDIYEAKDFTCTGSEGCNHCGGIVSESLIQTLATEGIVLPPQVIRRGIESYTMHVEQGSTVIETPLMEQRIASVFRGFGPKGSVSEEFDSFDNFLLQLCVKKGANKIHDRVRKVERTPNKIRLVTKNKLEEEYDLVVSAVGLNRLTYDLFKNVCPAFVPPQTTRTYIGEIYLKPAEIDQYFGNSMHVFLLDLPNIKFGALIPKGHYVTLVMLGSAIDKHVVKEFLTNKVVLNCFPPGSDLQSLMPCQCYPYINVVGARSEYADRVIIIGDTSSSKLYKNGIGAAHITAKAAAKTVVFEGISESDFKTHFREVCKELDEDNRVGKVIFFATTVIQRSAILKRGVLSLVRAEQGREGAKRRMSSVLWDTFTGSAPYRDIFKRFMNPRLLIQFIYHIFISIFPSKSREVE